MVHGGHYALFRPSVKAREPRWIARLPTTPRNLEDGFFFGRKGCRNEALLRSCRKAVARDFGLHPSGRGVGLEFADHAPDAIHLAALDCLDRGRTVECRVGIFEPRSDLLRGEQFFERGAVTLDLG